MTVYYNEFDPFAAAWLRELIQEGLIAPGDVDERSIVDVGPADLDGYTQCHFFAGIGGWSLALRLAGWPDDRPVWTGSCPCQPFSVAGKGGGADDPRHLWPQFARLIALRKPPVVFGEQVASKAGRDWLSGVRADLEALAYGVGAADLCAASVGAPHIRQRLWWVGERVADATSPRHEPEGQRAEGEARDAAWVCGPQCGCPPRGVADAEHTQRGADLSRGDDGDREDAGWQEGAGDVEGCRLTRRLADTAGEGCEGRTTDAGRVGCAAIPTERQQQPERLRAVGGLADDDDTGLEGRGGPVAEHGEEGWGAPERHDSPSGAWDGAIWHPCRDGKWRRIPAEPALFPLADGLPGRVGLLRGAGNAIVPHVAAAFVSAYLEAT